MDIGAEGADIFGHLRTSKRIANGPREDSAGSALTICTVLI